MIRAERCNTSPAMGSPPPRASAAAPAPRAATAAEVRLATLQRDARRPKAELLDEAMRVSRFAAELAAAGKRATR